MSKLILFGMISLMGALAQAQNVYYDQDAVTICRSSVFDSAKRSCMETIQNKTYDKMALRVCAKGLDDSEKRSCLSVSANKRYDASVIGICEMMTFNSDRKACLTTIENKRFTSAAEVSICRTLTFDSDKRKCLNETSTVALVEDSPHTGHLTFRQIRNEIDDALISLHLRDYDRAEATLKEIREKIKAHIKDF